MITRRERLKSALYLKLKKRKVFEIVKGGPFRLCENPVCCKISKKIEGRQKISKKSKSAEKKSKGDPIVPSGFVFYVYNLVHERGIFYTTLNAFPLADPVV